MDTNTPLSPYEQWFAPGAPVAELTYHGNGNYSAVATTVTRVTPHQIITETGRRFWRSKCGRKLVGQTDKLNGGIPVDPTRIVARDNPHAVRVLGPVSA